VFKIKSPVVDMYTSTDGSDLFSFFRPYSNLLLSWMLGVLTLTLSTDLEWRLTGTKEIQFYWEEMVPDLKIKSSRFPMPTILPA
jgi:hypothetical protein